MGSWHHRQRPGSPWRRRKARNRPLRKVLARVISSWFSWKWWRSPRSCRYLWGSCRQFSPGVVSSPQITARVSSGALPAKAWVSFSPYHPRVSVLLCVLLFLALGLRAHGRLCPASCWPAAGMPDAVAACSRYSPGGPAGHPDVVPGAGPCFCAAGGGSPVPLGISPGEQRLLAGRLGFGILPGALGWFWIGPSGWRSGGSSAGSGPP